LAERGDDVLVLAERFLEELRRRPGWDGLRFDAEALDVLKARSWSGNVRELRNAVERAAIIARGGAIGEAELAADTGAGCRLCPAGFESCSVLPAAGHIGTDAVRVGHDSLVAVQREHIARTLEWTGGKIYGPGGAAERLGLRPSTLQSRMKKLGLDRKR
jgi:transcriptional regulator with GAF, ATPase, and Fis domain